MSPDQSPLLRMGPHDRRLQGMELLDKRLRIGLLTHSVNPRGGVVHVLELAQSLHDIGHRVTVMAPASEGERMFRQMGCEVALMPLGPEPGLLVDRVATRIDAYVAGLSPLLVRNRFDVLHAHDGISGSALALMQDAGIAGPFVRTVHHLDVFADQRLMHWQQRSFARASQVFCVSKLWREVLRREHGIDADLVDNGIDWQRFSPPSTGTQAADQAVARRLGIDSKVPVLLAVGGVESRKNSLRLMQAFAMIHRQQPRLQLVIAGGASVLDHGSYQSEFMRAAALAGLRVGPGKSILLTGPLDDDTLPALYRLAAVVAMPSVREGFGLVVLEALASGKPVLVSRIAPFTEYLAREDCAWADPTDVESIAAGLRDTLEMAASKEWPARLGAIAARLRQRFDWRLSAQRHITLYRSFVARHQPVRGHSAAHCPSKVVASPANTNV